MLTDYTTTFTVEQTPLQVFDAINDVRGWWAGQIEGGTDELGDEFTYRVPDIHYSKQQIIELVPARRVGWLVVEAELSYLEDKAEWKGTTITFDISEVDGRTEVRFTHTGLVPSGECYDSCSSAWALLINGSLHNLITTGDAGANPFENH